MTREEIDEEIIAYLRGHHRLDRQEIGELRETVHQMQIRLAVIDKTLADLDEEVTDAGQEQRVEKKRAVDNQDWWKRQSVVWVMAAIGTTVVFASGYLLSHLTWK